MKPVRRHFPLSLPLAAAALVSALAVVAGGCASTGAANSSASSSKTNTEAAAAPVADMSQIKPVIDQRAVTALKAMSDALSKAKSMTFDTDSTAPFRGPNGQWIHLLKTAHVDMQRPNKLRVDTGGDAFPQTTYFDGKSYSVVAKESHLYTTSEMPSETIDAMLASSAIKGGNVFTFSDVLLSDPYSSWAEGLEGALYVGESTRGKEKLQHLALSAKTVHWEVWIGEKDHLPRLVYARFIGEQHTPSLMVEFSHWHLNASIPASKFEFKAPGGAKRAAFKMPTLNAEGKAHD